MMKPSGNEIHLLLLDYYSREGVDVQVSMIRQSPELFGKYLDVVLDSEDPMARRASWTLMHAALQMPELVTVAVLERLVHHAPLASHDAVKRIIAKILSLSEIPEHLHGEVAQWCFTWLDSTSEAIAVRAYCMDTLMNLCVTIPELRGELAATIEHHMDRFSAGLKNKGSKILKKLKVESRK
jgi:hypothetical protein